MGPEPLCEDDCPNEVSCITEAGKQKTFSYLLQLKFQTFFRLYKPNASILLLIFSWASMSQEVVGPSWQCQQRFGHKHRHLSRVSRRKTRRPIFAGDICIRHRMVRGSVAFMVSEMWYFLNQNSF